jgi:outer membrane protein
MTSKWKKALLLLMLTAAWLTQCLAADPQTAAPAKRALALEQCVDMGIAYSKTLHSAAMGVDAAAARQTETFNKMLPTLSLSASYTRLSNIPPFEIEFDFPPLPKQTFVISQTILNYYNFQLTAQQPLFTGFALTSAATMAEYGTKAARENFTRERRELVFTIKNTYWGLVKAREFLRLLDENTAMVRAHLKDVQNFAAQGLAKNIEVMKVQVQLTGVLIKQNEARQGVVLAMIALCSQIGLPLDTEIEPTSPVAVKLEELGDGTAEVKAALANRPEIKMVDANIKIAQAGVKLANSGWYPKVAVVANYYYSNPNTRIMPMEEKFNSTWDVSIGLQFNIWNWLATSQEARQARAQLSQAEDARALLRDGITLEVTQNRFELQLDREKILLAEEGVKQAEENHRMTRERFQAGLTTNSELLDAETALLQAKVSRTQAQIDYEIARAKLKKSLGANEI